MKQSREQIAFDYLKEAGPALISYEQGGEGPTKILLAGNGEAFWLNEANGPDTPLITLDEILAEAKHLLLVMFTAEMDSELTAPKLFEFEEEMRAALKKTKLDTKEVRDIKIKFLDVKEEMLK